MVNLPTIASLVMPTARPERRGRARALVGVAVALAASLALAACAGGGGATEPTITDGDVEDDSAQLNLSVAPVLFIAPAQHAITSGLLDEVRIEATLVEAVSPAETWPQLMSGDLDVAVMDLQQAILARSEGAPIVMHAPVIKSAEDVAGETQGFGMLMVPGDSPIQSLADMPGHTIGVNSMGNQSWLDLVTVLDRNGVDVSTVEFVEIPASRAVAAIQQGQVDSIVLGEPFGTAAVAEAGLRSIARVDTGVPGVPSFAWVTTEQFAAENVDLMTRFSLAMLAANTQVQDDRAAAVAAAQEALPYDPAVIEAATFPEFCTDVLTVADLQQVVDRMVKYGVIDEGKVPDLASLIVTM